MEAGFERRVLLDVLHTGTQAENERWRSSPAPGNGEVDSGEAWEITHAEVIAPLNLGAPENLKRIQFIQDDVLNPYISLPGLDTILLTPVLDRILRRVDLPWENATVREFIFFGRPTWRIGTGPQSLLRATSLKVKRRIQVQTIGGPGGVTQPYRIRLHGYRYKAAELAKLTPPSAEVSFRDPFTDRTFSLTKSIPAISLDNWTQLPGGPDQSIPKIWRYIRFATNSQPTQVNTPYIFRYNTGVAEEEEELYWPFDIQKRVLIIQGLGVRHSGHAKWAWFDVGGDARPKNYHPLQPVSMNYLHFGRAYPLLPEDLPFYYVLPELQDKVLVWNEKAFLAVQDDGTSVPAGEIFAAVDGIMIELA